jgi:class 3 adenylate cyclase
VRSASPPPRVEGLNKDLATTILITQETLDAAGDAFLVVRSRGDPAPVDGRDESHRPALALRLLT